jgi:hypothetical protein
VSLVVNEYVFPSTKETGEPSLLVNDGGRYGYWLLWIRFYLRAILKTLRGIYRGAAYDSVHHQQLQ